MALTTQRPGDYVATFIYGIGANVSIERLHQAWDLVAESNPILRTRIISLPTVQGHVLWQAVLDVPLSWKTENEGDVDAGPEHQMNLSEPLTRMSIIKPSLGSGPCCPYWKIHHALYDGWSINLFLGEVERAYYRQPESGLRQMQHFIRHLQARDESAEKVFWSQYFDGIRGAHFPSVPLDSHPRPDSQITFDMTDLPLSHCDYTGATIVTAAWATVAANEAGASEALFGLIVTGRQAPLKDIEFIAGPTIATVPKRVSLDWRSSHDHLLDNVQKGAAEMIPFEQTGLRNISRMSESAALACKFQTLLVIQPYMDVEDSVSSPIFYEMHDRHPIITRSSLNVISRKMQSMHASRTTQRSSLRNVQNSWWKISHPPFLSSLTASRVKGSSWDYMVRGGTFIRYGHGTVPYLSPREHASTISFLEESSSAPWHLRFVPGTGI